MAAERLVRGPVHREDGQAKTFVKIYSNNGMDSWDLGRHPMQAIPLGEWDILFCTVR